MVKSSSIGSVTDAPPVTWNQSQALLDAVALESGCTCLNTYTLSERCSVAVTLGAIPALLLKISS